MVCGAFWSFMVSLSSQTITTMDSSSSKASWSYPSMASALFVPNKITAVGRMIGGDRLAVPQDFARGLKKRLLIVYVSVARQLKDLVPQIVPVFLDSSIFLHMADVPLPTADIGVRLPSADMVREIRNASRYRPGFDPRKSVFDTVSGYCSNAECSLGRQAPNTGSVPSSPDRHPRIP
mgnify:CR=1 FL=1